MLNNLLDDLRRNKIDSSYPIEWYDRRRIKNIELLVGIINSILKEAASRNVQGPFTTKAAQLHTKLTNVLSAYSRKAKVTDPFYSVARLNQEIEELARFRFDSDDLVKKLNLHQRALAFGALYNDYTAAVDYKREADGTRTLNKKINTDGELKNLIQMFRAAPFAAMFAISRNMFNIAKENSSDRADRLKRYLPDFFGFICILDNYAFPKTGETRVYSGIPNYVMDGLSDMGSDSEVREERRSREKVYVNKIKIFKQAEKLFLSIFSSNPTEMQIVETVCYYVYHALPYDTTDFGERLGGKSIPLDAFRRNAQEKALAVCRHKALYFQVLLQAFGIECWLLKCNQRQGLSPDNGPHVANLARIDNRWHIVDPTQFRILSPNQSVWKIYPVNDVNINLNAKTYVFKVPTGHWDAQKRFFMGEDVYTSRSNMYYRIK